MGKMVRDTGRAILVCCELGGKILCRVVFPHKFEIVI